MFRRPIRILARTIFITILTLALISQVYGFFLKIPGNAFIVSYPGVELNHSRFYTGWNFQFTPQYATWNFKFLLLPPNSPPRRGLLALFIPWWLLLLTCGTLTWLVLFLTRSPQIRAFPIEPQPSPP